MNVHEDLSDDGSARASDIDAEAAHWHARLDAADLLEGTRLHAEFARWHDSDLRHAQAFARISETWNALGAHAEAPEIAALRREAREELAERRVQQSRRKAFRWAGIGALEVTGLAAAAVAFVLLWPAGPQLVTTDVGETRTVQLDDGSRMEVDAGSSVSVAFDKTARLVRVHRGQAYFEVAKHQARPFVVESGGRSVVATGTAFDVEALSRGLTVTLVEGHVLVRASEAASGTLIARLDPGDSLVTESGRPGRLTHGSNLLALLAWRTGHLVFDDATLADAVNRMNRYVRRPISVDPSVASFRVSGVFASGDLQGLIEAVKVYYPVVELRQRDGGIRLSRRT